MAIKNRRNGQRHKERESRKKTRTWAGDGKEEKVDDGNKTLFLNQPRPGRSIVSRPGDIKAAWPGLRQLEVSSSECDGQGPGGHGIRYCTE